MQKIEVTAQNNILDILDHSPSIAILRAKMCDIILEFFTSVFGTNPAISYENLRNQLTEFLGDRDIEIDEENDIQVSDTYEERAEKYIKKWTENGFLTNYRNEDGEIYYELSSHSSKVIDWVTSLKQEEYIGTESKFKSIITQLKELAEYTSDDKEKRLQLLEDKKLEIEQQIQRLKMGEEVNVFEDYQIVPRFQQLTKSAKELLSDFKDVDDNFKAIIKEIYKKQIDPTLNKGGIVQFTFDALNELKTSSQGKSFYSFWEFLQTREMQTDLETLISELFQTLKERCIDVNDTFLQNMVSFLYDSGRKVYQTNDKMANKLSSIIRENEASKVDDRKRIIQEIRKLLIDFSKKGTQPDITLEIDDGLEIKIPFDRKITFEQSENTEYTLKPESSTLSIDELAELDKVFGNVTINKEELENNIKQVLNGQSQTTLSDVITQNPLKQGLPELFAYFSILNKFPHKSVNDQKWQPVMFDYENKKRIQIPEVIISL